MYLMASFISLNIDILADILFWLFFTKKYEYCDNIPTGKISQMLFK